MTLKTIVVDDHAIVRRGIVQILSEHAGIDLVGEAGDYGQLRTLLRRVGEIDLLVMDVNLPGKDGIDILKTLLAEMPRLKVLVVSMYPEEQYAVRAFRAGAAGYLNKAGAPGKAARGGRTDHRRAQVRHAGDRPGAGREPARAGGGPAARTAVGPRIPDAQADRHRAPAVRHRRGTGPEPEDRQRLSRTHPGQDEPWATTPS